MERVDEKRGEEEWRGEVGRGLQTLEETPEEKEPISVRNRFP